MPRTTWPAAAALVLGARVPDALPLAAAPRSRCRASRCGISTTELVDPFLAAENSRAIVFLFASVDCPISNRYAPVVQRLHDDVCAAGRGVLAGLSQSRRTRPRRFASTCKAFNYPVHALRDPRHELVKLDERQHHAGSRGVRPAPDARVSRPDRRSLRQPRRRASCRHDSAICSDALTAVVAGKPP